MDRSIGCAMHGWREYYRGVDHNTTTRHNNVSTIGAKLATVVKSSSLRAGPRCPLRSVYARPQRKAYMDSPAAGYAGHAVRTRRALPHGAEEGETTLAIPPRLGRQERRLAAHSLLVPGS